MRSWTIREAKLVLQWAKTPERERTSLKDLAAELGRTAAAVQEFLRRSLPPGERPWRERPRWKPHEVEALQSGNLRCLSRTEAAAKKYAARHLSNVSVDESDTEHCSLTVTQVAADLGISRATVYRFLDRGLLRRFKGGIAETSFSDLLREHPETVPYARLPQANKEWLVLNGYFDPNLSVKRPSVRGLLD
jgi:hypothetical protein